MSKDSQDKEWKNEFYKTYAQDFEDPQKLGEADKLKFEHFPPVIGNFYDQLVDADKLRDICTGKLELNKAKLDENYHGHLLKIDYLNTIKTQLNTLMQQQINQLNSEDPNFLKDDEKKIIESSDFPFIKLMTLVYSKDTGEMTSDEQSQWKRQMNTFINQQIIFGVINTHYTMKLYQDNNYVRIFQTPYNRKELWEEYADNGRGFCVAYDFKEISIKTASQLKKLFPVVYVPEKVEENDYDVYNAHCASLLKSREEVHEYDNEWMYIYNHHFTEKEYMMLDNLLEPVYSRTTNHPKMMEIMDTNYLTGSDEDLEYDYNKIIKDITGVLESDELNDEVNDLLGEVYDITPDSMSVDYLKPEAIYLGTEFPSDRIEEFKSIAEEEKVRIFRIKQNDDGRLFKANV